MCELIQNIIVICSANTTAISVLGVSAGVVNILGSGSVECSE